MTRHNWLYYFTAVNFNLPLSDTRSYVKVMTTDIFLAGYCKACRQTFTEKVPLHPDGNLLLKTMTFPVEGCEPVNETVIPAQNDPHIQQRQ